MGKSITCTYRLELKYISFTQKRVLWQSFGLMRKDIKPTQAGIKKYRDDLNNSIINGCNSHLNSSQSLFSDAILINQKTGERIEYKAPMFEVI
jgi:hypothetical protein